MDAEAVAGAGDAVGKNAASAGGQRRGAGGAPKETGAEGRDPMYCE